MKTTNEKAKQWDCSESTVRNYCASGIIPPAEKRKRNWYIPDDWPKPPMTRRGLCYLLDTVCQINQGVAFERIRWGYSKDEVKEGFDYLISSAFISSFDTNNLSSELLRAKVTTRGQDLIAKEQAKKNKKHIKGAVSSKINLGIDSVEGNIELS